MREGKRFNFDGVAMIDEKQVTMRTACACIVKHKYRVYGTKLIHSHSSILVPFLLLA